MLQKMAFLYNALEDGWCIKKMIIIIMFLKKNMKVKKKFI